MIITTTNWRTIHFLHKKQRTKTRFLMVVLIDGMNCTVMRVPCGRLRGHIRNSVLCWRRVRMIEKWLCGKNKTEIRHSGSNSTNTPSTISQVTHTHTHTHSSLILTYIFSFFFVICSVNSIAWAPHEYGLMLACGSSDGTISILTYKGTFKNDFIFCEEKRRNKIWTWTICVVVVVVQVNQTNGKWRSFKLTRLELMQSPGLQLSTTPLSYKVFSLSHIVFLSLVLCWFSMMFTFDLIVCVCVCVEYRAVNVEFCCSKCEWKCGCIASSTSRFRWLW
jgi:hypothetical protein